MPAKLFVDAGNFRAFKILIAAEYAELNVEVPEFKAEHAAKSPAGKVPILETESGAVIFESNAIARYIARTRADKELLGATFTENALVDSWIDFSANQLELAASLWVYPVLGLTATSPAITAKAKADVAAALQVLNTHLADKTYLVGEKITLADITVASALVYPFKFVADPAFRAPFGNVLRWFNTLVHQAQFEQVIGTVVLAESELAAPSSSGAAPAAKDNKAKDNKPKEDKPKKEKAEKKPKEEKPKEEKKKAKKDDDDDEPEPDFVPEKKAEHPFKLLDKSNPSTFVMDEWKKTYSNCEDYHVAMDFFWSKFDAEGWSIFRGDYKYNEECKVLFMTSNLIGGFIQRTEEIRKWLFGTMTIRGVEGEQMKVTAYYLIRGDSIQPLLACNDDAECYEWTKMPIPASAEDKQRLYDYWCSEGPLDGEACLDSRCYK